MAAAKPNARVARRPMPDHAVGRVDGLVDDAAGKAAHHQEQARRDDPVGEILRQALDRGARDARFVEDRSVAPDDHRHRPARGWQFALCQGVANGADMLVETALRHAGGGEEPERDDRRERRQQGGGGVESERCSQSRGDEDRQGADARHPAKRKGSTILVEATIQIPDQRAGPGDGVTEKTKQQRGIADSRLGGHRHECDAAMA